MAQSGERFFLYLADALTGDSKLDSNLVEGATATVQQPESKLNYPAFTGRKTLQHAANLLLEKRLPRQVLG